MTDGAVEIDGIPERHGRGGEGQAGCTMALVLEGAVAQFAEPVEEDGAGERVAGLALVEDAAGAAPLVWIVEPVEHERSEEHTSELPSLMRISYASLCLQKNHYKTICTQ